jgi:hypothetical protein
MRTDLKSAIKTNSLTVFFALLGSARVKAAHKLLVKSTPGPWPTLEGITRQQEVSF